MRKTPSDSGESLTTNASGPDGPPAEAHQDLLKRDLVRGSLWTAIQAFVGLPMAFGVNLVVARSLGADGLGRLGTLVAGYALATRLLNIGWGEATVQWLAAARVQGDGDAEVSLVRKSAGYHAFVEGPILGALTLVLLSPGNLAAALIAALSVWLTQALGTSTIIMTATARNAFAAQLSLVINTASQAATLSVAATTHSAVQIWAVQLVVASLAPLIALMRLEPPLRRATLRPHLSRRVPPGFFSYAGSACASGLVATLVFGRSELFVLRADGFVEAAGIFVIITGLASQITIPMDSLMGPLTSTAAGIVASGPMSAVTVFQRSIRVSALLGALTASVAAPLTFVLLAPLYGRDYGPGRFGLVALVLVSCLQSVAGPLNSFAFATRSAAAVLRSNLICLAVDAALAVSLIPVLGLWGAVIANASSQVLSLLLLARIIRVRMKVSLGTVASLCRVYAAGAAAAGVVVLLCAVCKLTLVWQLCLVLVGPSLLVVCLSCAKTLRLAADDGSIIVNGLPQPVRRAALAVMTRLYLVRASVA